MHSRLYVNMQWDVYIFYENIFWLSFLWSELLLCLQVEKIFGPGNQYVTAAKMILQVWLFFLIFFFFLFHTFKYIRETWRTSNNIVVSYSQELMFKMEDALLIFSWKNGHIRGLKGFHGTGPCGYFWAGQASLILIMRMGIGNAFPRPYLPDN